MGKAGSIAVLPDYFVDRLVRVPSMEELARAIMEKSRVSAGGSLRGVRQTEAKGGNAVNMAYALGRFGADVKALAIADGLAAETLRSLFDQFPNVKLHTVSGSTGYTVAFEFLDQGKHVNVMVSDTGALAHFDGSSIPSTYWDDVSSCKVVSVLNWGANAEGNSLCHKVFSFARQRRSVTFLDPADPAELSEKLPDLRDSVLGQGLLDVLSLNENEARIFCRKLCSFDVSQDPAEDELKQGILRLADVTGSTVDLHTRGLSLSCLGRDCTTVLCHKVDQKTITGAGDIWDSAEVIGYLLRWEPEERLKFANAAAGLYVSRESAEPPSLEEIVAFMEIGRN